jgi:hypothetical protein
MGLKDLKLAREEVKMAGGSFAVRGLSFVDITALVRSYGAEIRAFYDHYAAQAVSGELDDSTLASAGVTLLEMAPNIAAAIIAHAADEPDDEGIQTARQLPLSAQIDALEKIARLTFEAEGGPKKVLEAVISAFRGTTEVVGSLRVSKAGSMASVSK